VIGFYRTNVHSISRREGLSNGAVNTIAKDSEGYIWFGTWNGLNRYDGSSIERFLPGGNPNSIHNHVIRELYPTSSGAMWMLTNKGISLYDNEKNVFYSFFSQESEQINYENDISLCHSEEYGTLVAVSGSGIYRYDSLSTQFEKIRFSQPSYQASLEVKRLYSIGSAFYCITGDNLLYKISDTHLVEITQLPLNAVISSSLGLLMQNQPFLFITQRGDHALLVEIEKKTVSKLRITDDIITSFASSAQSGRIWTGTEKGRVFTFDLTKRKFEVMNMLSDIFFDNLIATRVLSIFETAPDILWIGTDGNGVYNLKLSEFSNKSLSSKQLSYPIVRSILLTRNKKLLIGTKGGGIDIFDSAGNHIQQISLKNGLSNNSVLSFHERLDGSIWVGTDGSGIDIISPDFKTIKNFPKDFISENNLDFESVYRIIEEDNHRLYLGTSGYGVIMIEFDKNNFSTPLYYEQLILDPNINKRGHQKQIVYALTQERPGIIYIGTRGFGVYMYNTFTKRVMMQFNTNTYPAYIKNDDILSLFTDNKRQIWVGSSAGLFSFSTEANGEVKIEGINLHEDLSNASIHGIQMDGQGNIWATTNQGLSCIDLQNKTVKTFNTKDGLINVEYSDGASYFDIETSQLYVGGTMGVDIIKTNEIKYASFFPPIAINELYIRNQLVDISENSVLKSRINLQDNLNLKYNQNAVTFFVSILAFWGKERHKISYRLINFDNDWVVSRPNQAIGFTNLEAGNYRLQLRVSDENGNWSDQIKEIKIVINPPFWRSSWAIAFYFILIIGIQLLIIWWYRKKEFRKKELALVEYKQKKEKELQNYKIEFFTNVAHEFRTPLTLISSHIHALIEETKTLSPNSRLLKVYNNSLKLQKLVLEIIQFRKLEKGKEPLNISSVSPKLLALEVISDMETLAQKNDIQCEVICEEKEMMVNTDADKYQRVLTNLISNAIKYNNPGGYVKVKIICGENEFSTEVEDNGIGIKPELESKVFEPFGISSAQKIGSFPGYRSTGLGLAVTKGIVELLQGTITFESIPKSGTRFICKFPKMHLVNSSVTMDESAYDRQELSFIEVTHKEELITSPMSPAEQPTILLVDDDPEILGVLSDMLKPYYLLRFAENGKVALQMLEKQKIDLVVSDIMMPEMDGIELCNKMRENIDISHIPLILLTAKAEIEDRIIGLQAGADSYIPKPFHPDHLKIRIEKLLEIRQHIRKKFGEPQESHSLMSKIPDPFFQKMLDYIDENIDDDTLSADKLSERLGISKSSLYNKTKSVLGTTPHGLLNQRRVKKASVLLGSTSLTVSEIIDQTGFKSRAHFYELFNQAFGCSPSEYRQKRKMEG